MSATVPRFTPSNAPVDLLEQRFVGRHTALDDIAERISSAATSAEHRHTLLVGPRGAGKTHLLALAASRARTAAASGAAIQTSWPLEDLGGIASYRDLLREIIDRLEPAVDVPGATTVDALDAVISQRADELGPIVLFIERFDQVLDAIGVSGQRRLGRLLGSDTAILLVATTTSAELSASHAVFSSRFTEARLDPFDVRTAAQMLSNIAVDDQNPDLADFLKSNTGRARLRVIEHLAGGQPRTWATIGPPLSVEALDELVELILTRFDDVTPIHQERLAQLSPHQRRVVVALAKADRAVSVGELAELIDVEQRSVAKTVNELASKDWIGSVDTPFAHLLDGRKRYYELANPLTRLSFQIRAARTASLGTTIEFLKHWFEPEDFDPDPGQLAVSYIRAATGGYDPDPALAATGSPVGRRTSRATMIPTILDVVAALSAAALGDAEPLMRLPTSVRLALQGQFSGPDHLVIETELCRVQLLCETLRELTVADDGARLRARTAFHEIAQDTESDSLRLLALTGLSVMQAVDGLAEQAAASLEKASRLSGELPAAYGRRFANR